MNRKREYLGDGVYVDFDGYQIRLTTSDGVRTTNTIYLDPPAQIALVKFFERLAESQ